MIRLIVVAVVLAGCRPALVNFTVPPAADPAVQAWQQQITDRVNDLQACADVVTRSCVDRRAVERKGGQ